LALIYNKIPKILALKLIHVITELGKLENIKMLLQKQDSATMNSCVSR